MIMKFGGLWLARFCAAAQKPLVNAPAQAAIAWALAQPGVVCALTGPSTLPHLEENLGGSGWTLSDEDQAALERFFDEEDGRLRHEQMASARAILGQPLAPPNAFADLVYLLETLVERGMVAEHEILPLFQQLWELRGKHGEGALGQMQAIQAKLREQFAARLSEKD